MQEHSQRTDLQTAQAPTQEAPATARHAPAQERYVAGQVPAVGDGDGGVDRSASQLAFEEDGNTAELKSKVGTLVGKQFGGDYKKAFEHYDADHDGAIDKGELGALLKDASVGNGVTRGAWAKGIIEKLDHSGDGKIDWTEFEAVATGRA